MSSMATKKSSVTKKTAATERIAPMPTRPMTPAPAAFLLTARVLLLMTSKKPEGLLLCGSLIGAGSLRRRGGVHALDVDGVVIDGVAQGEEEEHAGGERQREHGGEAQPAVAAPAERRVEQRREPQQAIARRGGEELPLDGGNGGAIEVLEQLLRGLDQARRVGARGQPGVGAAAHEREVLNELVQPLVERGVGVGDARG